MVAALVLLAACSDGPGLTDTGDTTTAVPTTLPPELLPVPEPLATVAELGWTRPPIGAYFDYQLGGDYPPAAQVGIVTRDWFAGAPQPGLYNICYVNAFQTQPGERSLWPVGTVTDLEDPGFPGEYLVDISTANQRQQAASFLTAQIEDLVTR